MPPKRSSSKSPARRAPSKSPVRRSSGSSPARSAAAAAPLPSAVDANRKAVEDASAEATAKLLENYRSVLVIFFVLPLSFLFDIYWRIYTWWTASDPKLHESRVAAVQKRIREWSRQPVGSRQRMVTARPSWQALSPRHAIKDDKFTVPLASLNSIVSVEPERGVVTVEPGVTIGAMYDYLIPRGWTLRVWPEMDELTVGGLINGYGIETTSHRYGLFVDTVIRLQIILPDGTIKWVGREDPLFHAVPFSFGTVCFVLAAELHIQRATKYVRHQYVPVQSLADADKLWRAALLDPKCDTLEGIMFTRERGVLMIGTFTNGDQPEDAGLPKADFARVYRPYFYKHVEGFLQRGRAGTELVPLLEYFRRHNRSVFWSLEHQVPICHHWAFRWLLGWMLPPRVPLLKLIETDAVTKAYEKNYIAQDFIVPLDSFIPLMNLCDERLACYPLWLCPATQSRKMAHPDGSVRLPEKGGRLPGSSPDLVHFIDVAVIGPPGTKTFDAPRDIAAVEELLRKTVGFQGNYSYTYSTAESYRELINHKLYDEMRRKYGGDVAFPDRFSKIARANQKVGSSDSKKKN